MTARSTTPIAESGRARRAPKTVGRTATRVTQARVTATRDPVITTCSAGSQANRLMVRIGLASLVEARPIRYLGVALVACALPLLGACRDSGSSHELEEHPVMDVFVADSRPVVRSEEIPESVPERVRLVTERLREASEEVRFGAADSPRRRVTCFL